MAQTGYTLPVFAVASAKAALIYLLESKASELITLDLLPESVEIPIEQVALIQNNCALAITKSEPGDNLDLTRNTPIWTTVKLTQRQEQDLILEAGEGLGKTLTGEVAIYSYARRLFEANILPLIPSDKTAVVRIILPEGRQLAQRTSNEAFGVLEGLSLLGTSGISQPLSAADRLEDFRAILQEKAKSCPQLVFCIGSSGTQIAQRLGIPEKAIAPTGNWLGALLVEAALCQVQSVLLLGYQGKLIKLAGGIFNTSSHLADAKLEIIAVAVVRVGGNLETVQAVLESPTADAAYKSLVEIGLANVVFQYLAKKISQNSENYIKKYANINLDVGVILSDRTGQLIAQDPKSLEIIKLTQY